MNFEPQNVDIPGLALLKAMVPPHHAPVAPLVSQKAPRYTGPRKSKFALRKQAQVESQAQAQARAQKGLPPRPEQSCISSSSSSPSLSSSNLNNNNNNNNNKKRHSPSLQPDGRQVPSKESGGVPDPTPLYLAQSLAPPSRLTQPRRILVIMDLNGTLLYRPNKKNPFNFVERPHARQFLSYCLDTFYVAIWSSARPQNVGKMVAQLLSPQQREQCVVTWARDRFGLSPADYDARVQCYKRLTALWADPAVIASHPAASLGHRWDQTNTVLVDDSVEKARAEPHNILEIPEFSGVDNERSPLVLPQVHDYLNILSYQSDISRFIRQQPFKLDGNYRLDQPHHGPPGS